MNFVNSIGNILSRVHRRVRSKHPFILTVLSETDSKGRAAMSWCVMNALLLNEILLQHPKTISIRRTLDGYETGALFLSTLEKLTCLKRLIGATKDEQIDLLLLLLASLSNILTNVQVMLVSFTYLIWGFKLILQCPEEHLHDTPLTQLRAYANSEESIAQLLSMLIFYCELIGKRAGIPRHLGITGNSHRSLKQVTKAVTNYLRETMFFDGGWVKVTRN
jgi:hypothetical protein